jgi:hypothetical protein
MNGRYKGTAKCIHAAFNLMKGDGRKERNERNN